MSQSASAAQSTHHDDVLSTHSFSSLLTSALKLSTSCQQSSGRLSFSLKHRTTLPRAFSTSSGSGRSVLRPSSFFCSSSISLLTVKRLGFWSSSDPDGAAAASFSCARFSASVSFCCSFLSSWETRAWICSSTVRAREASVCSRTRSIQILSVHRNICCEMSIPRGWSAANRRGPERRRAAPSCSRSGLASAQGLPSRISTESCNVRLPSLGQARL